MLAPSSASKRVWTSWPPRERAYSSLGIERVISLRFVEISNASPPTRTASLTAMQQAIDKANSTHRMAGIQFAFQSYETYYMPKTYANVNSYTEFSWDDGSTDTYRSEFQQIQGWSTISFAATRQQQGGEWPR